MPRKKRPVPNGSLAQLADIVTRAGIQLKSLDLSPGKPAIGKKCLKPETTKNSPEFGDEEEFLKAMEGVDRACWHHNHHSASKPAQRIERDSEREALRLMQAILEEESPIEVFDHPEYIEGWIGVAGRRFLPKLRNGVYSIQGQIDLHGLSRTEAQSAVEDFIAHMSRFRSCCIKIIHGRGINSPTDRATLKESLQRLLKTRRMSRYVIAYASAPSRDGGVGAVYVLLKRRQMA
jgi:DNA-nicking Smr family endonuclease